jgi:hypothetical protein
VEEISDLANLSSIIVHNDQRPQQQVVRRQARSKQREEREREQEEERESP